MTYCHPSFGCDCQKAPPDVHIPPQTHPEALEKVNTCLEVLEQAMAALMLAIVDYREGPDKG